ncbi:MAG: TIGR00730 family Rossman fold protein [Gemmatimonadales bacterium]
MAQQEAGEQSERILLEGPHSRAREFLLLLRTVRDFLRGFRALHFVGPCVTVFGSARIAEGNETYAVARQVGGRLAEMGFTVMTGGGPGMMEAANRGAREAGGISVGCNIRLPHEQQPNRYLDRWVTCDYLFVRKVLLFKYSYAFVVMPGGMGTMDEMFEALTLIQTGKIEPFPVVLIGTEYWAPLRVFLGDMIDRGTISAADMRLILFTDDVEEMARHLQKNAVARFRLHERRRPKALPWLGERAVG